MKLSRIGIDLAKNVFQLHGVDDQGKVVFRRQLTRDKWLSVLCESVEPGCEVGMEACGGAHHWVRQLQARGFNVKVIAPQFVTPLVKSNKNDVNGPEAICEAMNRPNMRFVKPKTVSQQDIQAVNPFDLLSPNGLDSDQKRTNYPTAVLRLRVRAARLQVVPARRPPDRW